MKDLIKNREDFDNWCEYNDFCNYIPYEEDVPKYYPCIVTYTYVDSADNLYYDNLYYEFVYLQDFELDND